MWLSGKWPRFGLPKTDCRLGLQYEHGSGQFLVAPGGRNLFTRIWARVALAAEPNKLPAHVGHAGIDGFCRDSIALDGALRMVQAFFALASDQFERRAPSGIHGPGPKPE